MQPAPISSAIARIGYELGPDVLAACRTLFTPEITGGAKAGSVTLDQPYGPGPRQMLDVYAPAGAVGLPVLLWVHGGGFVRGDRRADDHPFEAHIGHWAASHGFVGVVPSYRLAPDHRFPAGGEDVLAAFDWVRAHVADLGGDPDRIILAGTSAGAVHVMTALGLRAPDPALRGAMLLSGLYGFTALDRRDHDYCDSPQDYAPRPALLACDLPLFVAGAEYDPPRFQQEFVALLGALLEARGHLPPAYLAGGHNHYSISMHLGSSDTRLSDAMLGFMRTQTDAR